MHYFPDSALFGELAQNHKVVPVYRQLLGDTLTPVSAFQKLKGSGPGFLFESVIGGERLGRFSFLGVNPFLRFRAFRNQIQISDSTGKVISQTESQDPTKDLQTKIAEMQVATVPGLPRFCGGAVGYAAYDTIRYVEHLPNAPTDDRKLPDLNFDFYDRMVIFDHINKTILVVVHVQVDGKDVSASYEKACRDVDDIVHQLEQPAKHAELRDIHRGGVAKIPFESNFTKAGYEAAVRKCQEYIFAGDIFQVVLSQRLQAKLTAPPFEVYRALRVLNPSPFMFFIETGDCSLVGSSPEIMTRVENGLVTIRPLAGTRPRGKTPEEDRQLEIDLLADPKERAEHIMLVDLGRNDVGRISKFGSVRLQDLLVVERYSHVMHISSTVVGQLQDGLTSFDALRSCLPAGTLSGAPKVRAMEIIDELEPHRRGPYGGAVGYVDFSGNMDTCIALRTMVIQGEIAYVQAGAGIVADSDPATEYQESLNKAMALLRALEVAKSEDRR
ncbi:anthranilate synthase component I [Telmatocola sphagniphila]|uniref:Anthranilate synthase component 1 n=1 Tax=Telmatocola sphagniphila TaxID=1123043 RepID=A0A8E6B1H9_9BACT|nr:anthranilate synthase component I [Telmatocola sphagniphila]QVL29866.1 anthranilate synthase component I [Telmatocola sphagniphila]